MAELNLEFPVDLVRNNNQDSVYFGKVYATSRLRGTLSTDGLAQHIAEHGSLVTKEVILLVLTQFSKCIPELLSQGYGVKLDGLGTFMPKVQAKGKPSNNIPSALEKGVDECVSGVKMNFIPQNEKLFSLASKALKAKCSLKWGNFIRMDYVQPVVNGPKTYVPTLLPLDTIQEYLDHGGTTAPQKLQAQNP